MESDAHRQSSRAQIAGVRKAVRKDSLCGKGVLQRARGKGGRGYERSRWSMTSAEGTSWARHFGATEIHGQANTCIVARTAGDIGAEAHAEIDFVVHAHTANLRALGKSVLVIFRWPTWPGWYVNLYVDQLGQHVVYLIG